MKMRIKLEAKRIDLFQKSDDTDIIGKFIAAISRFGVMQVCYTI
jgi:hypothetical protein